MYFYLQDQHPNLAHACFLYANALHTRKDKPTSCGIRFTGWLVGLILGLGPTAYPYALPPSCVYRSHRSASAITRHMHHRTYRRGGTPHWRVGCVWYVRWGNIHQRVARAERQVTSVGAADSDCAARNAAVRRGRRLYCIHTVTSNSHKTYAVKRITPHSNLSKRRNRERPRWIITVLY
jgi:hypothetical protein